MSNLISIQEAHIDFVRIEGDLDDNAVEALRRHIAALRQNHSRRLLWLGETTTRIRTVRLNTLELALRNYRRTGGTIALAAFTPSQWVYLKEMPWYRYINSFQSQRQALNFLQNKSPEGAADYPTTQAKLTPAYYNIRDEQKSKTVPLDSQNSTLDQNRESSEAEPPDK